MNESEKTFFVDFDGEVEVTANNEQEAVEKAKEFLNKPLFEICPNIRVNKVFNAWIEE